MPRSIYHTATSTNNTGHLKSTRRQKKVLHCHRLFTASIRCSINTGGRQHQTTSSLVKQIIVRQRNYSSVQKECLGIAWGLNNHTLYIHRLKDSGCDSLPLLMSIILSLLLYSFLCQYVIKGANVSITFKNCYHLLNLLFNTSVDLTASHLLDILHHKEPHRRHSCISEPI